jgi:DNA repair photolyase
MQPRELSNPPSPFTPFTVEYAQTDDESAPPRAHVTLLEDATKEILSKNDSPDLGFRYSVNPYRGCMHACAYCYARRTHEYLDMGAGTDFDTRIVVKRRAPELLRATFEKPSWEGELVMFSGVTDCYQPFESELRLTRGCLEVCLEYRNPVGLITKGTLVERDVDVLAELARVASARVHVSLAFRDADTARAIEPWTPTPARRLRVIETLAKAGIPVGIMIAPVIPGLNDDAICDLLLRARDAGADSCGMVLLRLPGSVAPVFEERLRQALPLTAEKVMHRIRETRGDRLYDPRFFARQRGEGPYARMITELFESSARKLGYRLREDSRESDQPATSTFRRPERPDAAPPVVTSQLSLF